MSARIGIVGAGSVAQLHADGFGRAGNPPAVVCDVDLERARTLAAQFPGAEATTDLDALLARDDVDAVVIGVPNDLHKPLAVRALRAGKDVLLEKPMALTTAECDEIIDVWRGSGRLLQMGFVCRFTAAAIAAKRTIDSGRLGRVQRIRVSLTRRRGIPGLGRWFTTRARSGGGVLIDIGVHVIDLAMHLTGRPRPLRVSAACASSFGHPIDGYVYTEMWGGPPDPKGTFDVEDSAVGLVRFEEGLVLELDVAWASNVPGAATRDGILVLGDDGGMFFDLWSDRLHLATERDGALEDVVTHLSVAEAWPEAWQRQSATFTRCVTERVPATAPPEHGRSVQAILDAFYRSSEAGAEVAVT